ncbi:MAG: endopeptidase La, partial [Candidatus Pacebacteria bacterium]|nr:endopeptidase La [Candidatus Paceibacterota bacterium]
MTIAKNQDKKPLKNLAKKGAKDQEKTKSPTSSKLPSKQLVLPVIPIREGILFPHTESVLTFGRQISLAAIKASRKTGKLVVLVTQKNSRIKNPKPKDLYKIGTLAIVERTLKTDKNISALVRGIGRVEITNYLKLKPVITAQVLKLANQLVKNQELTALASHLHKLFREAVQLGKPVEFLNFMKLMSGVNEGELADQIASTLKVKTTERQKILETLDVKKRLETVIEHLSHEIKVLEIEQDVASKTQKKFDKHMRKSVLRERLKTIQKELGELEDEEALATDYNKKLKKAKLPAAITKKVKKEIKRLKQMSANNPEAGYIRTWLDTVFEIPWQQKSRTNIELKKAAQELNKDHYGLKEVKDRVLEYISVLQLKQQKNRADTKELPTILCFVGPPGVGKTSIGRAIASALGRKFTKMSLGGIRDEAEIRGHRRTYVGAMSGKIIKGIINCKTMNPVFMLDEIDKIGKDFRGDPAAALLETLDPEQNKEFVDHYLDFAIDLSDVLFITTANTLDPIPPALKDRLEVIRYPGYTLAEKFQIAKKHLMPKVLKANALKPGNLSLSDNLIKKIIQRYTREAGVRELERTLGKVMRKIARKIIETQQKKTKGKTKKTAKVRVTNKKLQQFLGPEKHDVTLTETKDQVGVATGLAWTKVGGDVLFVEVALTPGKGKVKLTGKLGEVMK